MKKTGCKSMTSHLQPLPPNRHKLYETTLVRHGIMLVGPTGGGKTKIFRCLRTALDKTMGITHKDSRFNPKAIRAQEMYGEVDPSTGEWNTGTATNLLYSSLTFWIPRFLSMCSNANPKVKCTTLGSPHRCFKKPAGAVGGNKAMSRGGFVAIRGYQSVPRKSPCAGVPCPACHRRKGKQEQCGVWSSMDEYKSYLNYSLVTRCPRNAGVFAAMWAKFNNRQNAYNTWIIADGPVDAIWIEDLNTVLDDNKILTLANGDRMPMTDNVKAMFEVQHGMGHFQTSTWSISVAHFDRQPLLQLSLRRGLAPTT